MCMVKSIATAESVLLCKARGKQLILKFFFLVYLTLWDFRDFLFTDFARLPTLHTIRYFLRIFAIFSIEARDTFAAAGFK